MKRCIAQGDWSKAARGLSLARAGYIIFSVMGSLSIWQGVFAIIELMEGGRLPTVTKLSLACVELILSIVGCLSIKLCRHSWWAMKVVNFWAADSIALLGNFFILWFSFGMVLIVDGMPSSLSICDVAIETVIYAVICISIWWQYNVLVSLFRVFYEEGDGREFKNFKELRISRIVEQYAGTVVEYKVSAGSSIDFKDDYDML